MDIRIFALVAFIAVLGSFTEARSAFGYPYGNGGLHVDRPSVSFAAMSRLKREIDDSNGESTTKETTTTSTEPTTTPSSTTPSSTTPSSTTPSSTTPSSTTPSSTTPPTSPTTPSTTPTTTTEATSPTTTPISTSTPTSTTPTTPSTTPSTTTPESTTPKKPKDIQSRSNVDEPEPEESTKKPGPSKDDKAPGPYFGPPGFGFGGPGFDPYFGYPGFNSIPGYSPNYAWTGTNNGPGYASAGASAGFGYPGIGYPTGNGYPFPTVGSPTGLPTGLPMGSPTGLPTGSPSFGNRGGFQDNSPNQNGYPNQNNSPNKANSPNQNGYFGGDPLYNAGPGFFYPGQFPNFNDPTFDMIKQIQAQIEAQHRANMDFQNRLANEIPNYGNYGGGVPQVASASIGLGPYGGFQSGQISPAAPGIESRFADDLPPPSGNSYGVFASSSSSSMTGPDGQPINHKSSITGVNDNGKISYRTVHD